MKLIERKDLPQYEKRMNEISIHMLEFWKSEQDNGKHIEYYYKKTKIKEELVVKFYSKHAMKLLTVGIYILV